MHAFFPYESHYQSGIDLLSVGGGAAVASRDGGGRLVISNAKGEQIVSAFPFGLEPSGRWSLARMTAQDGEWIVFSGPSGTKRIPTSAIGQIGWEDVSFDVLSNSTLLQSSGRPTSDVSYDIYDLWPRS